MEVDIKTIDQRLIKLARDVEFIKELLLLSEECELSDWAKEELATARKIPVSKYASLKEVKKRLMQ